MRNKLAVEMKQKVDDEDDRLGKAVAERDDKMAKEEQAKQEKELLTRKSIHQHRIDRVRYHLIYALEFLTIVMQFQSQISQTTDIPNIPNIDVILFSFQPLKE